MVVQNIPSYAGGADLWGHNVSNRWAEQNIGDGIFEVIGIRGAFHLGQIQGKMAKGVKIAQGNKIEIICLKSIEAQIDGEPFKLHPSHISINLHNQAPVLLNTLKDRKGKAEAKLLGSLNQQKEQERVRKLESKRNLMVSSRKLHSTRTELVLRKSKSEPEAKFLKTVTRVNTLHRRNENPPPDKEKDKEKIL